MNSFHWNNVARLPGIANYMRVPKDDPVLLQAQETFAKHLTLTWTPSLDGTKFILDFVAEQRPALKGRNPAAFVNVSFLKKLEDEGFFRKLSGTPFFSEVFGLSSRSEQKEREKSFLDASHSLGMAGLALHLACIAFCASHRFSESLMQILTENCRHL